MTRDDDARRATGPLGRGRAPSRPQCRPRHAGVVGPSRRPPGAGNDPVTVHLSVTVSIRTDASRSYSRCSSFREHRHVLLRIELRGPPVSTGARGPAARAGGRWPATPAEPARRPRHQTTVAPLASSDRPSGPKMRIPGDATAGADPDGGKHPVSPPFARSGRGPGRGEWDAGSGPRQCRSGPDPARPARGRNPGACGGTRSLPAAGPGGSTCRQVQAVRWPARSRRRPRPRRCRPRVRPDGSRGARCSRPPAGSPAASRFPTTAARPWRPSARRPWRSPSAGGGSAPVSGSGWSSGWRSSSPCSPGPASTSGPCRGWPWPSGRRCTWGCWAAPPRSPRGCPSGRSGPRRCGWPTRRCGGGSSWAASRGGGWGSARRPARSCRSRPTAASRS